MGLKSTYNTPPLTSLPPELLIHILSFCDVQSLASIQLVSKTFDALFKDPLNESVIWRNACVIHGLVGFAEPRETSPSNASDHAIEPRETAGLVIGSEPPRREWGRWREWAEKQGRLGGPRGESTGVVWQDVLDLYSAQSFSGLSTEVNWKAFFKRRLEIHRSFVGQLPSDIVCYKDSESSDIDDDADSSYFARLRRIYGLLLRIRAERNNEPHSSAPFTFAHSIWGNDSDSDEDEEDGDDYEDEEAEDDDDDVEEDEDAEFYLDQTSSPQHQLGGDGDDSDSSTDEHEKTAPSSEPILTELTRYIHTLGGIVPSNEKVHRIKVDERNGFFLMTSGAGGLVVRDVESKRVLWELPKCYVRAYAHLEYENGYIIFDRANGSKEVWRSSSIPAPQHPHARVLQPDDRQRLVSALAAPFPTSASATTTTTTTSTTSTSTSSFESRDDADKRIRHALRSEAMIITNNLPTRQRLLDMADSHSGSLLPIEAIVRITGSFSEWSDMPDAGFRGLDFGPLESQFGSGSANARDEGPSKSGKVQEERIAASESASGSGGGDGQNSSEATTEGEPENIQKAESPHRLSPHFVPHLVIPIPQIQVQTTSQPVATQMVEDPTRAYRFVYPHLLAASSHRAYVWDVRTGEQVQVVENIQKISIPEGYGKEFEAEILGIRREGEGTGEGRGEGSGHGLPEIPPPAGVMAVLGLLPALDGVLNFVQDFEDDDDLIDEERHMLGVNVHPPPYAGPQPGGVDSSSSSKGKGKEKATIEEEMEDVDGEGRAETIVGEGGDDDDDPAFPTFKPFKSGWWDANSTFSGNGFSPTPSRKNGTSPSTSTSSSTHVPHANSSTTQSPSGRRKRGDPLALISNISTELGNINYVELGERWIFLCGEESVRVFARGKEFFEGSRLSTTTAGSTTVRTDPPSTSSDTNNEADNDPSNPKFHSKSNWTPEDFTALTPGQLALRIPSDKIQYSRWSASLGPQSYRPHWGSELVRQEVVWDENMAKKTEESVNVGVVDSPGWSRMQRNRVRSARLHRVGSVDGVGIAQGNQAEGRELDEREANGLGTMIKRRRRMYDEFVAVHVSPCQNHLALLLSASRLLFVPYFERLIRAEEDLWDVGVDVQLGSVRCPSVYLSYGGGEAGGGGSAGRVGVVTQQCIYVITPYLKQQSVNKPASPPFARPVELIVMRLAPSFMDPRRLIDVSCLQMSDTGVWVNYDTPEPPKIEPEAEAIKAKVKVDLDKGKNRGKGKTNSGRSGRGKRSGVAPRYGEEDEDDEMFGNSSDYDEEMVDEDLGEDVYSEEDDDETDDEALEPNPYDDEALEPYPYGDDEAPETNPYHSLDPGQSVPLIPASRPGWVVDPRYPMLAIQFNDEGRTYAQAVSSSSSAHHPCMSDSTSRTVVDEAKGKERANDPPTSSQNPQKPSLSYHSSSKSRRWINQHFPLDTTPPSQFQVAGGKCKWNHAEISSKKRKLRDSLERDATLHDVEFTIALTEKRINEHGMGIGGVQNLPNGDILIETEDIAGDHFTWIQQRRTKSEVHQIRFVPSGY